MHHRPFHVTVADWHQRVRDVVPFPESPLAFFTAFPFTSSLPCLLLLPTMMNPMGPPPPKTPNPPDIEPLQEIPSSSSSSSSAIAVPSATETTNSSMHPPPPRNLRNPEDPEKSDATDTLDGEALPGATNPISVAELVESKRESSVHDVNSKPASKQSQSLVVPYKIPPWSGAPCHKFYLEVLKDGSIIDQFDVYEKGAFMFGRVDLCDFVLEHPTISRFHAVLQFKRSGNVYLYDLGSTHGTFINKNQVEKKVYIDLHVGDVLRFGQSSRLYIFQGPPELMPPEIDLKVVRDAKMCEKMLDREASLRRARQEASLADGISWGMGDDAIDEDEDDGDEVTWQSYKGKLTEKQEKTREKIIKRMEKIANMKKEISAIRSKDIAQGGLTQGQQTQIARNEQRIAQIMEELDNLEETLNDSIRESISGRTGKASRGKKKGTTEEEEDYLSDDDEFYDRTKKKLSHQKSNDNQSIETADTLLDKRDAIMKEIEEKKELLEKNYMAPESTSENETGDALDAYMSGLSSQLVVDKANKLQKEISILESDLDRVCFLLKIADPTGEAAKKRELKAQEPKPKKSENPVPVTNKQLPKEPKRKSEPCKTSNSDATMNLGKSEVGNDKAEEKIEVKPGTVYTMMKPQWLGATDNRNSDDSQQAPSQTNEMDEPDQFVDYKDRNKILGGHGASKANLESDIESAASGLILRRPKLVEKSQDSDDALPQLISSSVSAQLGVEDAVALLLKHKRGYYACDAEGSHDLSEGDQSSAKNKKPKRVLGPEKPSFLINNADYETWVPPQGQSGDGRTSLHDKYGY